MMSYQDLAILPHQEQCLNERCAMCGRAIWWVMVENREYHYCRRCKVVKSYIE